MVSSLIGCSTTRPQPIIYGYTLNSTGIESVVDEDGKEVILDENHKIKTIKSTSGQMDESTCTSMKWNATTELKLIIQRDSERLHERYLNLNSRVYENNAVKMTVINCKKIEDNNEKSYAFTITVDSIGDNVHTNETMKSIKKFFAKLGMNTLIVVGVILLIPVFILGVVFISIPALIIGAFTGGFK
jgi:hypothetical protein